MDRYRQEPTGSNMTDILIRDLDPATLAALDEAAAVAGQSRAEFLRSHLRRQFQSKPMLTVDDLQATTELLADALNPDATDGPWH